jgi:hypothetical protein
MRQPPLGPMRRPFRKPGVLSYWDAEPSRVNKPLLWISSVLRVLTLKAYEQA